MMPQPAFVLLFAQVSLLLLLSLSTNAEKSWDFIRRAATTAMEEAASVSYTFQRGAAQACYTMREIGEEVGQKRAACVISIAA